MKIKAKVQHLDGSVKEEVIRILSNYYDGDSYTVCMGLLESGELVDMNVPEFDEYFTEITPDIPPFRVVADGVIGGITNQFPTPVMGLLQAKLATLVEHTGEDFMFSALVQQSDGTKNKEIITITSEGFTTESGAKVVPTDELERSGVTWKLKVDSQRIFKPVE